MQPEPAHRDWSWKELAIGLLLTASALGAAVFVAESQRSYRAARPLGVLAAAGLVLVVRALVRLARSSRRGRSVALSIGAFAVLVALGGAALWYMGERELPVDMLCRRAGGDGLFGEGPLSIDVRRRAFAEAESARAAPWLRLSRALGRTRDADQACAEAASELALLEHGACPTQVPPERECTCGNDRWPRDASGCAAVSCATWETPPALYCNDVAPARRIRPNKP